MFLNIYKYWGMIMLDVIINWWNVCMYLFMMNKFVFKGNKVILNIVDILYLLFGSKG